MEIYLPIAEIPVNVFVILGLGAAVGFLSGMFGVGGGFLLTPLLIFSGIPPIVAVATGANQIVASSFSGALAFYRRNQVDVKLGMVLLAGGMVFSVIGVFLVRLLRETGQLDLVISICYLIFLGAIGSLMVIESIKAILKSRRGEPVSIRRPGQHTWVHGLPFQMRFKRSKLCMSAIPVVALGALVGLLTAIMGVGGGFIMVPAMIYLLRVPTNVVIGTSLFQITFVTVFTTIMHAVANQSVDVILALMLIVGGVVGTQFGARASHKMRGEHLRALLGLIVLAVCLRLGWDMVSVPTEFFSIDFARAM